jgi:hypothetical protein
MEFNGVAKTRFHVYLIERVGVEEFVRTPIENQRLLKSRFWLNYDLKFGFRWKYSKV